jgi:ATP-binding cassette subfamily B multidrug efflux pump
VLAEAEAGAPVDEAAASASDSADGPDAEGESPEAPAEEGRSPQA